MFGDPFFKWTAMHMTVNRLITDNLINITVVEE